MKKKLLAIIIPIATLSSLIAICISIYANALTLVNHMIRSANPPFETLEVDVTNWDSPKITAENFEKFNYIKEPVPEDFRSWQRDGDLKMEWKDFSLTEFSVIKSSQQTFKYSSGEVLDFTKKWRVSFKLTSKGWIITDVQPI